MLMGEEIVLVTGATGALGPTLVNYLLNSGYAVRSYGLDRPHPRLFGEQIEHITGDINDEERLLRALAGADTVFHLAALLHIENPDPSLAARYQQVNVQGSRNVAEQAAKAGARRLIYFSTVKVYGVQQSTPVTEDYPTDPQTLYAKTKLEGEKAIWAVSGLETTALRLAAVYGPRLKGPWNRLVHAIERGWFLPIGDLQNRHSLISVTDVARAAVLVSECQDSIGRTINLVGYETPTLQEILEAIYTAFGKRVPPVRIPGWLGLLAASLPEHSLSFVGKRSPITRISIGQLIRDEVYSGAALRELGFESSTSLAESWKEVIEQMDFKVS
jgi:UDP-glucose 4-epimerase